MTDKPLMNVEKVRSACDPDEAPCDCRNCDCDNTGDIQDMAAWRAHKRVGEQILALLDGKADA